MQKSIEGTKLQKTGFKSPTGNKLKSLLKKNCNCAGSLASQCSFFFQLIGF